MKLLEKKINFIEAITKDNRSILINNKGDELFEMNIGIRGVDVTIYNAYDDYSFGSNFALIDFLYYIDNCDKYDLDSSDKSFIELEDLIFKYNTLNKYNENNKEFEDNPNYQYLYFKNTKFTNYVLQVVKTQQLETDNHILNLYFKNCEYSYSIDFSKMEEFYNYKKEFYLIDFTNNKKTKLACDNLFYEAIENDERILLLSNGYIPFYDKAENGCFNLQGQKIMVTSNYLLYDIVDNNTLIIDRKNNKTLVLSGTTNNIIKEFEYPLIRYNGFYISYLDNGEGVILDNNFSVVTKGHYIKLVGDRYISLEDENNNNQIYNYSENNINKIDKYSNIISGYNPLIASNYSKSISTNIYSILGIEAPEER